MTITIDPRTEDPSRRGENAVAAGIMRPRVLREPDGLMPQFAAEVESHGCSALVAVLVHELRNPLACVTHAANVLRNPGAHDEADQREWAVASIERQIDRLTSIVDDMLGASQANGEQAGRPFTLLDAAAVIECAKESVRALMEAHGHTLTVNVERGSLWLRADAGRLEQVLVNLLTNAVRYTQDGGHIALRAAREGAEIVIRVEDSGIGIAEGTIDSLFNPFYRGEAARIRAGDGLGIGLTVVRRLVELHGGRVDVFSEGVGRGSTFVVRLPAATRNGSEIYASGESAARAGALRILIVDDSGDLAGGLSRLLQRRGHKVECAQSGAEALRLAHGFLPEFVLVDVSLPDLNGYEVAAMLPGVVNSKAPRIASFSGYSGEEETRLSSAAGCVSHLRKPVDIAEIEALLAGCDATVEADPRLNETSTWSGGKKSRRWFTGETTCPSTIVSEVASPSSRQRVLTPVRRRLRLAPETMSSPFGNSHFPTTRWTGVMGLLGAGDLNLRKEALANLCRDYWYPLYAFARRLGWSKEDAEDLAQGFFVYALENEVFDMADRNLGTLRTFLLKVFQRYIGGVRDRDHAQKRGGGQKLVSLDLEGGEELYAADLVASDTPEMLFDRSWAQSLLRMTLSTLAASEQSAGREQHFARLQPFLTPEAVSEQSYEAVARELGLTPEAVRQAVSRLRKKFRECLREQIAATLHEPDDDRIDTELRALKVALRG